MAQKWKFEVTDTTGSAEFDVFEDNEIVPVAGDIATILTKVGDVRELMMMIPLIVGLMKVNTITKIEINEIEL